MLPTEHGSWGMFYVPMVVGALAAGRWSFAFHFFFVSATAMFLSREPLLAFWRARRRGLDAGRAQTVAEVYLVGALLSGAALVVLYRLFELVPVAAAAGAVLLMNAEISISGSGSEPLR